METFSSQYKLANSYKIRAAAVGQIGDPNMSVRLRRSSSEMTPILVSRLSRGSNITDGNNAQMYRVSAGARVGSDETKPRKKYMQHTVRVSDKVPSEERNFVAKTCAPGKQAWYNKRNSVFYKPSPLSLPNGYEKKPGQLQRGILPVRTVYAEA